MKSIAIGPETDCCYAGVALAATSIQRWAGDGPLRRMAVPAVSGGGFRPRRARRPSYVGPSPASRLIGPLGLSKLAWGIGTTSETATQRRGDDGPLRRMAVPAVSGGGIRPRRAGRPSYVGPSPASRLAGRLGWLKPPLVLLSLLLLLQSSAVAQDDDLEDFDDVSLMFDLDTMSSKELQALADKMIKNPEELSAEDAASVIAQPKLNDAGRAARLYRLVRDKVTPELYEVIADSAAIKEPSSDPVTASFVIRLIGLTRNPEARETLLNSFGTGPSTFRAAAAHGIGYFGDKRLLPLLQKAHRRQGSPPKDKEYADGLVRGMLLLGDFKPLPGIIAELANVERGIVGGVMQIASHFSSPKTKHQARKRLVDLRKRQRQLLADILEIAPLFPAELAGYVVNLVHPGECDVIYRLLPQLITEQDYARYIPALRCKNPDIRQLILDLLMDGRASENEVAKIRALVVEWYEGNGPMDRLWAIRNCGVLEQTARRQMLLEAVKNGDRWERVEAIDEIRRAPDAELLSAVRTLLAQSPDPDVAIHARRLTAGLSQD